MRARRVRRGTSPSCRSSPGANRKADTIRAVLERALAFLALLTGERVKCGDEFRPFDRGMIRGVVQVGLDRDLLAGTVSRFAAAVSATVTVKFVNGSAGWLLSRKRGSFLLREFAASFKEWASRVCPDNWGSREFERQSSRRFAPRSSTVHLIFTLQLPNPCASPRPQRGRMAEAAPVRTATALPVPERN
jgi:hypothetical protein